MASVFSSATIGTMNLTNRFVRSATWAGMADDDGNVTPELIQCMARLATGTVGLIVTGHAFVHISGKHSPRQLGIDDDLRLKGLEALTLAVHDQGGKVAVQLGYGGAYLSRSRVRQMTTENLRALAGAYARAAVLARTAGFDGIQIFAAHGFFLSQLLCPRYNDRRDVYGGSLENRARFLMEVLDAIRQAVGGDFPVFVKLNATDGIGDGLSLKESVQVGTMLASSGIDAIEISGGLLNNPNLLRPADSSEAAFEAEARSFKAALTIPVILVGGVRSLDTAQRIVTDGIADFVAMSRPFICEPDLISRWKSGDVHPAACASCNNCVEQVKQGKGLCCVPEVPVANPVFYPQFERLVDASPPHPAGTRYVVSFGLQETASGYLPMVKVHMTYPGSPEAHVPVFPPGSDDHQRVHEMVSASMTGMDE